MALSYKTNFSNNLTELKGSAWSRIIGPFTEPFSSKEKEEKSFGQIVVSSLLVLAAPFIALFGALHTAADALRLGTENAYNKTTDVKLFGLSPTFFIVATALTTVVTLFVLANFGLLALSIPALEVAIASLVVLLALNFMSKTKEELNGANESMSYNAKATLGLLTVLAPVVALFLPASPIALIALSLAPLLLTALGLTIGAAFTGNNVYSTLTTDLFGVKKSEAEPEADKGQAQNADQGQAQNADQAERSKSKNADQGQAQNADQAERSGSEIEGSEAESEQSESEVSEPVAPTSSTQFSETSDRRVDHSGQSDTLTVVTEESHTAPANT